jgi:hypothetical protein
MAQLAIPMAVIGTVMSARGEMAAGKAQAQAYEFQARQYQQQALADQASSQRKAIEERRKADLAISRGRAVAAASGAGASDVTVNELMGGIAETGDYNVLSALFEGDEAAAGKRMAASAARYQGAEAKRTAKTKAFSTIMSGASNLAGMSGGSLGSQGGGLKSGQVLDGWANPDIQGYDPNLPWVRGRGIRLS